MKNNSLLTPVQRIQPLPRIALFLLFHLALLFSARLVLFYFLWPNIFEKSHILQGLYIGFKFDARYAVFMTLPIALSLLIPPFERTISSKEYGTVERLLPNFWRRILCLFQSIIFGIVLLLYIFDFGFFFYLQERLDMTAISFLEDPLISAVMVWESYPVPLLLLLYAGAIAGYTWIIGYLLRNHAPVPLRSPQEHEQPGITRLARAGVTILGLSLLFAIGYGQISSNLFPLRWSNAYFSQDKNIALLALHPLQNLYDTRKVGQVVPPDLETTREAYPRMAKWLRLETGGGPLSYIRSFPPVEERTNPPLNVVVIIMESLAWPRTSLSPRYEDVDPTPFIRELAEESIYFPNFYAPTRTTARAIFTTITGIPDVNHSGGTTSRNPLLVNQNSVFSQFKGYEKYYMIGGSASWANIRGLLQYNIEGLHLLEEGAWEAPNVDVWGISDLALFREAVGVLSASDKPFAAVIQSAAFHRPYTIPKDNEGYIRPPAPSPEALRHYGFENEDEFVSLHFSDYSLRRFFDRAKEEPWFENTVFAIFGDHGLTYRSDNVTGGYLACMLQAWHTPLLLYSPGRLAPQVIEAPAMQPDVLVTMAALAGIEFKTNTMGRNMLAPSFADDAVAFISGTDSHRYLVKDGFCFTMNTGNEALYSLDGPADNLIELEPDRAQSMRQQVMDFYHTSKYLLHNNSKDLLQRE